MMLQTNITSFRLPKITLLLLVIILYGNTINHNYALDDAIVITQNSYTKKGFRGITDIFTHDTFTGFFGTKKNLVSGGRYRPLSLVTFAIEYQLFNGNPKVSHFINILLYALTILLLFNTLNILFIKYQTSNWYLSLPFIITILYCTHPIHTEVVANIKGRDEILTFLCSLLALFYTLKYISNNSTKYLFYVSMSFFLGLLAKENAITFLGVIPLTIYFFMKANLKQYLKIGLVLILPTIVFLSIRYLIIGSNSSKIANELMNNPFLYASFNQKYATIFSTFAKYFKLLVFPHPLTFDYYPKQIPIVGWNSPVALFSLFLNMLLIGIAISMFNKKSIISYSIWFYFITFSIVSNIIFPIGTFMNERFIYISSLGFCIILGYGIYHLIQKRPSIKKISLFILSVILVLYSAKTISRNKDWKNDFTLFTHDVKISSNSAKSNTSAGGKLLEEAVKKGNEKVRNQYLQQSIQYLEKAIKIHPTYVDALLLLGNAWYEYNRNYNKVLEYYSRILKINPKYEQVFRNVDIILNSIDSTDFEIETWLKLYETNPNNYLVNYNLGNLYGRFKNNLDKSIFYLEKAVKIDWNQSKAWKDLGVAYGIKKDYKNSARCLEKAIQFDKSDAQTYFNLGITYLYLGNKEKSDFYFNKATQLNPKLKQTHQND